MSAFDDAAPHAADLKPQHEAAIEDTGGQPAESAEPAAAASSGAAAEAEGVFVKAAPHACEVCRQQPAKYRCPGCHMRSCCLACSKQHKAATGCSGKRKVDGFVDIRDLNINHLMSDYTYLEVRVDRFCVTCAA